jgi:hypothetical protein
VNKPYRSIDERKEQRAAKQRAKVADIRDRRRFKDTPVPTGEIKRLGRAGLTGSIFPSKVKSYTPNDDEVILKDGAHNCKIGGDVHVGSLKGSRIVTLSLEERATCPKACLHWRSCYGNSMGHARRWRVTDLLLVGIENEVRELTDKHEKLLVRLHVLGDFPNQDYVDFWAEMLHMRKNLHIFGFTGHAPDTPTGVYIEKVRRAAMGRFSIRHSGTTGEWGTFTVDFPTEKKRIGDAVVCPEQRDSMNGTGREKHCGSCSVCWETSHPIVFVEHG